MASPTTPGLALGFRYGLYPFAAENDDEISFVPGERIEILEQDDQYGDGWWQGRNEAGQEGLFPALDYTSADPPSLATDDLPDDHQSSQASIGGAVNGLAGASADRPPSPRASTPTNGRASPTPGETEQPKAHSSPQMNATLTDVQAAIDQLGGRAGAGQSTASIPLYVDDASVRSFASDSLHGGESLNGDGEDHEQVGWSAKTRRRLAEKALAENQRRLAREAEQAQLGREREADAQRDWQAAAAAEPLSRDAPEGLEFSDESEDEETAAGTPRLNGKARHSPRLDVAPPVAAAAAAVSEDTAPAAPAPELAPPVALGQPLHADRAVAEDVIPAAPPAAEPITTDVVSESPVETTPADTATDTPSDADAPLAADERPTAAERAEQAFHTASTAPSAVAQEPSPFQTIVPDQFESPAVADEKADVEAAAPDSTPKSRPGSFVVNRRPSGDLSKVASPPPRSSVLTQPSPHSTPHSTQDSLPDLPRERMPSVPTSTTSGVDRGSVGSASGYMSPGGLRRPSSTTGGQGMGTAGVAGEPIEWGVADVVEWAKRRGFDESVWGKFEEHEITGDVLLEMDINLLKEIEITAFGKRMKLAAAIAEIRPHVDMRAGSIRSGYSPTQASFTPQGSFAGQGGFNGVGPSPGFVFGQQSRTPSDVYPNGIPTSASQYASNWSQEQGAVAPAPVSAVAPPVVGLGFAAEDKTRQSSVSAPASPLTSTGNVPAAPPAKLHTRTPSGVESLHGTRIDEEPANFKDSPPVNLSSPTVGSSSASPLTKNPATLSRTDVGSIDSRTSSVPPSPASGVPPKKGSISHKKSKASVDGERSFMSGFMSGSKNGRKPAPRVSGGSANASSPDLSSKSPRVASNSTFRRTSKAPESDKGTLKKRMSVVEPESSSPKFPQGENNPGATRALDRIPKPEFAGYLRKKGERYNSWKLRYCVLAGPHFYYLKSENDAKFKGYINLQGYKVIADENANPGSYGFRIVHDKEPAHFFSSQDQHLVRDWMKSLMKATISRDYSAPVVSSCNIATMSLKEAQSMSPAPRPPSPSQRLATQLASRRENPNQLTARDASILMGIQNGKPSVPNALGTPAVVPPRPSRDVSRSSVVPAGATAGDTRRTSQTRSVSGGPRPLSNGRPMSGASAAAAAPAGGALPSTSPQMQFINASLPADFPSVTSNPESFRSGLALVRAVEHITGTQSGIPLRDFVVKTKQEHEDLLYRAFDYFIDQGVDVDGLHVEDVVLGNPGGINNIIERVREMQQRR